MSCVLRFSGNARTLKTFFATSPLARFIIEQARPRRTWRYVALSTGDADLGDLEAQIADASAFLSAHHDEIRRLGRLPGVEPGILDVGLKRRDVAGQFDRFPATLIRLAALAGVGLEVSYYRCAAIRGRPGKG